MPGGAVDPPGHNPLGGWSILALLSLCLLQAASGLLTRDDVVAEGPLAQLVTEKLVDRAGALHASGAAVPYALIALHLVAIAFYRIARRQDLVTALFTAKKIVPAGQQRPEPGSCGTAALILFVLAGALVGHVVHLAR